MDSNSLKDLVVEALEDIKGIDIKVLDVREQTDVADYMIVATGNTSRQVNALIDNVSDCAKAAGVRPKGQEGQEGGEWVLLDLIDVVLHVMLPASREFYDLEKLWSMTPAKKEGATE